MELCTHRVWAKMILSISFVRVMVTAGAHLTVSQEITMNKAELWRKILSNPADKPDKDVIYVSEKESEEVAARNPGRGKPIIQEGPSSPLPKYGIDLGREITGRDRPNLPEWLTAQLLCWSAAALFAVYGTASSVIFWSDIAVPYWVDWAINPLAGMLLLVACPLFIMMGRAARPGSTKTQKHLLDETH